MITERAHTVDASIFRAYDIRGIVDESLPAETVFLIGQALGSLVRERGDNQIVIGRDGRLSGVRLAKALADGILATGCDVIDIGMVPTPVLYYATHVLEQHSGVMLTGSHNPPQYNGLKMVVQGATLAEEHIQALYQRIIQQQFYVGTGVYRELNIINRYLLEVAENVQLQRPLKIVIDAGNGVTGMLAPALFRALGCEVQELFCEVDGTFPNHHPDPSQTENLHDLIHAVRESHADIGLAFDGDGDRLGVVTTKGEVIWPDRLLMLYAQALLDHVPHANIIYDVKCTHHLDAMIRKHHGNPMMWKTGHSLIKAKMAEINAELAGEMSGHFFFKHRWYGFDDALYAGARLLEILSEREEDSDEVFATIPNSINTPELKVLVTEEEKFGLMQLLIANANFEDAKDILTIDGLRVNFSEGWGLVRPSNTTPYLVLRFEAINQTILENIQLLFRNWMLAVKPDLVLPF
jgi:phosphomannomutase/phosphoglucomutase